MNKRRIFLRAAALLVVVCLIVSAFSVATVSAATQADLEKKLSQLEAKEKQLKSSLSSANTELSGSQKRLNTLNEQIKVITEQIDTLTEQADLLQSQITEKESTIAARQEELQQAFSNLKYQVRELDRAGSMSDMQMLLENENYVDYLILSHFSRVLSENEQTLAADVETQQTVIQGEIALLDEEKAKVDGVLSTAASKKKELDVLYASANAETAKLKKAVSNYQSQLSSTQKEEQQVEKQIADIIKSKSSSTGKYSGGTMFWPVPTVKNLSSTYGTRTLNGTTKLHKGIDIANGSIPIYGESVVAAADGTVIYANKTNSYGGGYGYYIMIDHGKDSKGRTITTLYAHNSKVLVSVGDKVIGGQTVIAKAGNSGNVTGPHLHFEVRVDGTPVDPIANGYLKKN